MAQTEKVAQTDKLADKKTDVQKDRQKSGRLDIQTVTDKKINQRPVVFALIKWNLSNMPL